TRSKRDWSSDVCSSDLTLLRIAKTLDVRVEYFFRPATVTLDGIEYRKRSNTPQRVIKRIEADVLNQAERWEELANLWPAFPIPQIGRASCRERVEIEEV